MLPHGLWGRSHDEMLAQVVESGFNSIRLPFSNAMLHSERIVDTVDPRLAGLTPIQAMDLIIETAGELGLKIVLDNHSRAPTRISLRLGIPDEVQMKTGLPIG